jgi:hypothetical protein
MPRAQIKQSHELGSQHLCRKGFEPHVHKGQRFPAPQPIRYRTGPSHDRLTKRRVKRARQPTHFSSLSTVQTRAGGRVYEGMAWWELLGGDGTDDGAVLASQLGVGGMWAGLRAVSVWSVVLSFPPSLPPSLSLPLPLPPSLPLSLSLYLSLSSL